MTPSSHAAFVANLYSLSQTQRRLSHRARRIAVEASIEGNRHRYLWAVCEADRLWREAKQHFRMFRRHRERIAA